MEIADITCVAMSPKQYVIATVVPVDHSINDGWLAFIDPSNQSVFNLFKMKDCFLPDHVTTTNDGNIILVSCEAEPSNNEAKKPQYNPPGSVGFLNVTFDDENKWEYYNLGFAEFDIGGKYQDRLPEDIYIPLYNDSGNLSFSITAEPEHIVVDFEDKYAYIGLQESNAVGLLDIENMEIINIFSLGFGYFGDNGGLDPSDKDDGINIQQYDLYAMRQPDDIDYYQTKTGRKFIFTANEGDSKGWDEERVEDLELDPDIFGPENVTDILQDKELLGRLKVSKLIGQENDTFSELYTFSSRDFTVYEIFLDKNGIPQNISLHFSSDNDFEMITSKLIPDGFNADYEGCCKSFDSRSDAKGPEPEGITIGQCPNGRLYVFICMERVGGIFAYDFTDIENITFADYYNNRNFSLEYDDSGRPPQEAGDIGPEQMRWIDGDIYGNDPLLVVSNPQSASVTMYRIDCGQAPIKTTQISTTSQAITTTTKPNNDDGSSSKKEKLTTLEIVAIAVGSFAVLSIMILVIWIICKRKNGDPDQYKYNSLNEFGNAGNFSDNRGNSGHYFELEKN